MDALHIIGLVLALAVLIVLVFKKVPIIFAVIAATLVAGITNSTGVWEALNNLARGTGNTFTNFMFVFLLSTLYGELMASLGLANSIANFLVKIFGKKNVGIVIILTTGLLVFGGVTAMVVCFTVVPIGISLLRQANISKKFLPGLISFGQATFALTALPASPQLNNIIPTAYLGTTSTAAPLLGCIAAVVMLALGIVYFWLVIRRSQKKGETFDENLVPLNYRNDALSEEKPPHVVLALLPMVLLVGFYLLFENVTFWGYKFSEHGAYAAISTAMFLALVYLIILGLSLKKFKVTFSTLKKGGVDWISPLLNFSMIVGFGVVIQNTEGFTKLVEIACNIPGPKYISAAISVCLLAGVTGSASGGLNIALGSEELVASWLSGGTNANALHRIISVASGGLDSLPHCGGILATLDVCGESHSNSYIHIFVTTVVIPIIATVIIVGLACLGVVI